MRWRGRGGGGGRGSYTFFYEVYLINDVVTTDQWWNVLHNVYNSIALILADHHQPWIVISVQSVALVWCHLVSDRYLEVFWRCREPSCTSCSCLSYDSRSSLGPWLDRWVAGREEWTIHIVNHIDDTHRYCGRDEPSKIWRMVFYGEWWHGAHEARSLDGLIVHPVTSILFWWQEDRCVFEVIN